MATFGGLLMPLDAGMSRLALARALAPTEPETARDEATRAAVHQFASPAMTVLMRGFSFVGSTGHRNKDLGKCF